jgi:hypothetical protein
MERGVNQGPLLVAQQLTEIFDKAQDHHAGRPHQPDKEKNCDEMHDELQDGGHERIVTQPGRARNAIDSA